MLEELGESSALCTVEAWYKRTCRQRNVQCERAREPLQSQLRLAVRFNFTFAFPKAFRIAGRTLAHNVISHLLHIDAGTRNFLGMQPLRLGQMIPVATSLALIHHALQHLVASLRRSALLQQRNGFLLIIRVLHSQLPACITGPTAINWVTISLYQDTHQI
jgi:hypothetical protein